MIFVFDTETSGLPDFNKRARDPSQPHIVQLSMALFDFSGVLQIEQDMLCKPDGWTIPPDATAIHGITNEHALANGFDEKAVVEVALDLIGKASVVVGHNVSFDKFMVRIAARRFDLFSERLESQWGEMPTFCTMKGSMHVCNLPGGRGSQPKWPKLIEAYRHCFGKEFENQHNALADVRACAEVFFWLKNNGHVPEHILPN